MTPSNYITQPILNICNQSNQIVIIGPPVSGKSSIAAFLANNLPHALVSTDHYLVSRNQEEALTKILEDVSKYNKQLIIEGTLGFVLLRKGLQSNSYIPDLIIKLKCDEKSITHLYNKFRDPKKLNYVNGYIQGVNKVWNEYIELHKQYHAKTKCIEINTSLTYL